MERELQEIKQSIRKGDEQTQDTNGASQTDDTNMNDLPLSIVSDPQTLEIAPTGMTIGGIHLPPPLLQGLIAEYVRLFEMPQRMTKEAGND